MRTMHCGKKVSGIFTSNFTYIVFNLRKCAGKHPTLTTSKNGCQQRSSFVPLVIVTSGTKDLC